MHSFLLISAIVFFLFSPGTSTADTIYVDINTPGGPGSGNGSLATPYYSIQDGINGAVSLVDTVSIAPGTYNERISFVGKNIVVEGQDKETTIINGSYSGVCVLFYNSENSNAVLQNLTITAGQAAYGGAIYCDGTSPTIRNNIIHSHIAWHGAGIYCDNGSPRIENNFFTHCVTDEPTGLGKGGGINISVYSNPIIIGNIIMNCSARMGGGLYIYGFSNPQVINNIIIKNTGGLGAGINVYERSFPIFTNNTIADNSSSYQGGGVHITECWSWVGHVKMHNNIFWGNSANYGKEMYLNNFSWVDFYDGVIEGGLSSVLAVTSASGINAVNMITADPLFVDPSSDDFHLQSLSPCIDSGDNGAPNVPAFDFEGQNRIEDGDLNGTATVDMGADEFPQPTAIILIFFKALNHSTGVTLKWKTGSELNSAGFHLWRSNLKHGDYRKITKSMVPAKGGPSSGADYELIDSNVKSGQIYFYKLEEISMDGKSRFYRAIKAVLRN